MDSKPKDLFCLEGISCSSYNKDRSMCALSKKDSIIYIFKTNSDFNTNNWELVYTLTAHLQLVYSIDWHPETDRIISGSHDRNILIWTLNKTKNIWEQALVNFKTKISVSEVKWSQRGDKFLACSSRFLATGYYDIENNWWTCKSIKEHKSFVSCARFDKSGLFILSGSTDKKAIVSSAYIDAVDSSFENHTLPFEKSEYGKVLLNLNLSAWVNSVEWSPESDYCFIATHDSILTIIETSTQKIQTLNLYHSPISHLVPHNEYSVYAIAYDRHIYEYTREDGQWACKKNLTGGEYPKSVKMNTVSNIVDTGTRSSVSEALKRFEPSVVKSKQSLPTNHSDKNIHSATISSANIYQKTIVTTDYSGFLKIWNI